MTYKCNYCGDTTPHKEEVRGAYNIKKEKDVVLHLNCGDEPEYIEQVVEYKGEIVM